MTGNTLPFLREFNGKNMKTKSIPLNTINKTQEVFNISDKIKSVLLVDSLEIDNFVNHKLLEIYGVKDIITFRSAGKALTYLKETNISYQLILVEIYLPITDGFEFIDMFYKLNLHKKHGEICLLSASLDPFHKQKSAEKNVRFIEKPLTIQRILSSKTVN
jgi:response regulator RpfG family c-di-GMP phosphodiesterase